MEAFDSCLNFTRNEEGGYTCDPHDSGNWSTGLAGIGQLIGSNMGVSAPTLISWVDRDAAGAVDSSLMRSLPEATYQAIARARYWRSLSCDGLAASVAMMVFDFGWNVGVGKSARLLQTCVGMTGDLVDGDVGLKTLSMVAAPAWTTILDGLDHPGVRQLQALCKIEQDGLIGPGTLGALEGRPELRSTGLVLKLTQSQTALYRSSLNFARYGRGWLARTGRRSAAALALL
jgi:lysozyme family protein